jgi:adenylosuccinate synthase
VNASRADRLSELKHLIVLSGPVAVGKSALAQQFEQRFDAVRISTRSILLENGVADERTALTEAGQELDKSTDCEWVATGLRKLLAAHPRASIVVLDSVRRNEQLEHLRSEYGTRVVHVHVIAPEIVLEARYRERARRTDTSTPYEDVVRGPTEQLARGLGSVSDVVVENNRCEPPALLARAAAHLGLFPLAPEPSVDVIVGGQYGSEGKGHICAYLAPAYDILVRVGGPNAGHRVACPPYKYIQLPSGTQSNAAAKILIGAGATIWPETILKEITDCKLSRDRLTIDENAMVIESSDRAYEEQSLDAIGSTKQGVGVATARKILGRDGREHLGSKVRLARHCPELKSFVGSAARLLEDAYAAQKRIMLEGTQGTQLSLHHASYPHVTSRETTAAGCIADAGIAPLRVRKVILVTRTYPIRVGGESGPIAGEINPQTIADRSGLSVDQISRTEVGTVSGKARRIGEFDWELLRRSASLNGATDLAITFADYLSRENENAHRFERLSLETRDFIAEVEKVANAPVSLISTKFDCRGIIDRRTWR